jgi:cell wall-associated NlpC family hydrolase
MTVSGLVGAAVVLIGVTYVWHHPRQTAEKHVSKPKVTIKVGPSKPVNFLPQTQPLHNPHHNQQLNQVYTAVQQMLQSPTTLSLDTSGFVQSVYAKAGVKLPRTIAEQAQTGTIINNPTDLIRGDLIFFDLDGGKGTPTFDGIYLGNNQFAALTTHGLKVINLNDSYWSGKFLYGRRVL